MSKAKKYWQIFLSCFYISAFTFGGGFVIIPLLRKKFVEKLKWLEESEMMDITAIAQSSPGAIAVNAAILTGFKVGGLFGAFLAMIATILPPMLIITGISFIYDAFRANAVVNAVLRGMRAGVAAVICDVVINMATGICKQKNVLYILLMVTVFTLTFFLDVNVMYVILSCIAFAVILYASKYLWGKRKKKKAAVAPCAGSTEQNGGTEPPQTPDETEKETGGEQNEDTERATSADFADEAQASEERQP